MKRFIIQIWILFAMAGGCTPPGTEPTAWGAPIQILAIDGMGAPQIVWNSLAKPMAEKYGANATYSTWQDWGKYAGQHWNMVIGHSLGGDSADQLVEYEKAHNLPLPDILVMLGARHQSAASWFDFLFPLGIQGFVAPMPNTHNFYTIGLLSSQSMPGAIENVNVTSLSIWHGNIPSAPAVQNCVSDFLTAKKLAK